jgi:cell division protein FtsI (penicillin-binding protein 3)
MQMLAAYNTVANGGTYVAPKLVKAVVGTDGEEYPTPPSAQRRVISERTAAQLVPMLIEVVKRGTGELAAIDGYTVAGKTGTARKPDEKVRGYKAGAYVASFAGFVPAEKPALSAIVILDEPTPIYGGIVAAPVFSQVAKYSLRELRIPPPA